MISIYSGETIERDETIQNNENDHIHTVEQCIEKQKNQAKAQGKCSVWSKAPGKINGLLLEIIILYFSLFHFRIHKLEIMPHWLNAVAPKTVYLTHL